MPAIREHDVPPCTLDDDDDGMPPLVDHPNPSMTFTFFTDMTPITALSADPTIPFETLWENPVSPLEDSSSPPAFAEFHDTRETPSCVPGPEHDRAASHGKKRDASYIPRPPNAFILFRSSFIRSQQVPEKVEGNHSTLSKIIGKYWKTLPREEREVWEAKALVAQAEHRKRYPDWRFRPGANALAKLKVKDGPQSSSTRKRSSQSAARRVKGDSVGKKVKGGDERCTIIADLLMEGKTGTDLVDAVRRWEDGAAKTGVCKDGTRAGKADGDEHREAVVANEVDVHEKVISTAKAAKALAATTTTTIGDPGPIRASRCGGGYNPPPVRAHTPDAIHDDRFRIPLTAMFKRSLSAPAPGQSQPAQLSSHHRHGSLDAVFANVSYDIADSRQSACPASFNGNHAEEDLANALSADSFGSLSPLLLPSVLREGVPARWNDPYNLLETSIGLPPSPNECPGLTYALHSPSVHSPVENPSSYAAAAAAYTFCSTNANDAGTVAADLDEGLAPAYVRDARNAYCAPPPKSWADCAILHEQTTPIFINQYAGPIATATTAQSNENNNGSSNSDCVYYDWCAPAAGYGYHGAYYVDGAGDAYPYPFVDVVDPFGVLGCNGGEDGYARVHAGGECLPAVVY